MRLPSSLLRPLYVSFIVSICAFSQDGVTVNPADAKAVAGQTESLADRARKLRKDKAPEARTTLVDAKTLFESVDEIFRFASHDTGYPIRSSVKRRLISREDIEKRTRDAMTKADLEEHFTRAELTMKKFGLLPRNFNTREFMVSSMGRQVAGYYDPKTKMISLVNWVPLEALYPIMAHELTHALQDQNYDLDTWAKAGQTASARKWDNGLDESVLARHAVGEGQAMLVYYDFVLGLAGRNMRDTPGVLASMEDSSIKAVIDTEFLHNAPMILREAGTFPYHDGTIFEAELLARGGTAMAFAGAFARPPRNSHEVLQPRAYIEKEDVAPIKIPDLTNVLAANYEVYDSGTMGELDVRALLKQYGGVRANDVASKWQGGSYVVLKRARTTPATPADISLLYISRWKTDKAAIQFEQTYVSAVPRRYQQAALPAAATCNAGSCPVSRSDFDTEEGPVIIERWADNTVLVSESFDRALAAQLRDAIRNADAGARAADSPGEELSARFLELPAFREFQMELERSVVRAMAER